MLLRSRKFIYVIYLLITKKYNFNNRPKNSQNFDYSPNQIYVFLSILTLFELEAQKSHIKFVY